jgi:hypothetical protein
MFTQTLKKYLPVVAILLKRTTSEPQVLSMNHTDFERAAGGRKVKCSFAQLHLNNGRINTEKKPNAFAKTFGDLLREDKTIQGLMAGKDFEFSMSNDYKLTIKDNTPVVEVNVDVVVEQEETEVIAEDITEEAVEVIEN